MKNAGRLPSLKETQNWQGSDLTNGENFNKIIPPSEQLLTSPEGFQKCGNPQAR